MCTIIGFLETPLVTREWYWVQYSCGTYLKAPLGQDGYSGYFKGFGGAEVACPVHQSEDFKARRFDTEIVKFGDRQSVDIDIGK
jgi:hypothetical protein